METVKRLFISLLVLLGCSAGAWAIEQDTDGYYLIGSVQDWKDFAELVETEPTTNGKLIADVDLGDDQTMVGSMESPYRGIFDGQGYTLTVNYDMNLTTSAVAPFTVVGDAVIQKLHVAGSIKQQYCAAGGVVGSIMGNVTIKECWVSAYMYVRGSGNLQGTIGGIASCCDNSAARNCSILIEDCVFSGEMATGYHCGSIMSHVNGYNGNSAVIRNCLAIGTYFSFSGTTGTFIRVGVQGDPYTIDNCYYKTSWGAVQGTQATETQLSDGTTAAALGDAWVQDPELGIPMLKIFADAGENVIDPSFISGLVQHWPFDGDATNSVSEGVDATVYGATLTTDRFGNENSAYYFDGGDKMIAAGAANFGTTSFTANIWVSSTMTSGLGNLMRTDGGFYDGWLLRFNSGRIEIWEGRSYYTGYVSSTSYADGNWHMVTFVRDVENKVGQLYVDGSYVGGYSMGSTINDVSNELRFGTYGGGEYYTGKMDDACLYNRALSAEEIAALYTQNGFTIYTVPASGLGTFSAAYNIVIPEELTAYYCTTLSSYNDGSLGIKVSKLEGGIIPANTGVLIEGPANQSYTLLATKEETTAPAGNSLVAVVESKHIAATDGDYTNFMMKGGRFIKIADDNASMPAHRAYLPLLTSAVSGSNAKEIMLYWDDEETTGVERMRNVENEIMRNESIYNLNGQKLSSPRKGINIINGRKVIVK